MNARADLRALRRRPVPAWWRDAKLGIFVHWTPASVVGWAPVDDQIGDLLGAARPDALAANPYTEWYQNSLRFPDSPASVHHRRHHPDTAYEDLLDAFESGLASWDPDDWAARFAATGARYVVLVAKHHDGFCLWPTSVPQRPARRWHTERDVVGELGEAVRRAGMRFGLYYSGGLDWTFDDRPIGNLGDLLAAIPQGDYPEYARAQVLELIDRYRPAVLWNDIAWPSGGAQLWPLLRRYYDAVPDGVVNDRWMPWSPVLGAARFAPVRRVVDRLNARATRERQGVIPPRPPHFDVRTPEYVVFDSVRDEPWECVRGIDHSFGFNRNSGPDDFLRRDDLVEMFADIVAKGGNLLLNVGPRGEDATIPDEQQRRLDWLAEWTGGGGASVFGTRPWVVPLAEGTRRWRFWSADRSVYASTIGPVDGAVVVPAVLPGPATTATLVGGSSLDWRVVGGGIEVRFDRPAIDPVIRFGGVQPVVA
ncbi:MAG: alpha-L-fucosidase [Microthrixaceae bacterium]